MADANANSSSGSTPSASSPSAFSPSTSSPSTSSPSTSSPSTSSPSASSQSASSPSRRNWNGPPGDRYVHENVWVVGGPKGPATAAPWKLDAPVEGTEQRRGSDASISSTSSNSGRRKSSTPGLFANLTAQKRTSPESDPSFAARRDSWSEQRPKGGPFAKWWDGYTRGP